MSGQSFKGNYLAKTAIKDVEWAVVLTVPHVADKVLHLHLHRVSLVILATLELLIAILLGQTLF